MGLFDRKTRRTHALAEYARRNGHAFQHLDDYGMIKYFGDLKLFRRGGSKRIRNIRRISRSNIDEYGHFDYRYVVSTGNSAQEFKQTVYYRINKTLVLPQFHLFPERWYHQIGKWFGMQDINFMEYPEFSKAYLLQGGQESFIRTVFEDRRLVTHFRAHRNWSIEAVGYYYIMYRHKKLQQIGDLPTFVRTGNKLFEILSERSQELQKQSADFKIERKEDQAD